MLPHAVPPAGARAGLAARLAALVPVLETPRPRLRAMTLADVPAWTDSLPSDRARFIGGPLGRERAFGDFRAALARGWPVGLPAIVSRIDPGNPRSAALARAPGAVRDPVAEAAFAGTDDQGVEFRRHIRPEAA
jgi:RimJ/RimL family protein N-acetyltransferase